ncbi:hypothetical protein METHPM2_500033 [Pseudomonas sp. PM2]
MLPEISMAATISHDPRRMDESMIEAPQVKLQYGNLSATATASKKGKTPNSPFLIRHRP